MSDEYFTPPKVFDDIGECLELFRRAVESSEHYIQDGGATNRLLYEKAVGVHRKHLLELVDRAAQAAYDNGYQDAYDKCPSAP